MDKYRWIVVLRKIYRSTLTCMDHEEQKRIHKKLFTICDNNNIKTDVLLFYSEIFDIMDRDLIIKKYTF